MQQKLGNNGKGQSWDPSKWGHHVKATTRRSLPGQLTVSIVKKGERIKHQTKEAEKRVGRGKTHLSRKAAVTVKTGGRAKGKEGTEREEVKRSYPWPDKQKPGEGNTGEKGSGKKRERENIGRHVKHCREDQIMGVKSTRSTLVLSEKNGTLCVRKRTS